jgi:hypothetical protein
MFCFFTAIPWMNIMIKNFETICYFDLTSIGKASHNKKVTICLPQNRVNGDDNIEPLKQTGRLKPIVFFLSPIPSTFNHSIKDWWYRQMWLFVLSQEHSTDINYQCWLHWHPIETNKPLVLFLPF